VSKNQLWEHGGESTSVRNTANSLKNQRKCHHLNVAGINVERSENHLTNIFTFNSGKKITLFLRLILD